MVLTIGDRELPRAMLSFCWKNFIITLKICGSQTNLQQFYNGFGLQGRLSHRSVIVVEFIADDSQDFIDWHVSEKAGSVKTKKNILKLKCNGP
jgi:hypothetical protein